MLILGPTGSGKEVVARIIHELSSRHHETFQAVNCAALPDSLFESEVFGYERGAFTGAYERKPGRIELANHGTLFLDEVGDLSPMAQAKMLRVTEEHRVERLGARTSIEVDFRLICATNRPLESLVGDGTFREDLYYRINAFAIRLPALRERPADIPVLADRFLARYCAAQGLPLDARRFAPDAMTLLVSYPWPGNIRELETTVSRAALSAHDGIVRARDLQFLHPVAPAGEDRTCRSWCRSATSSAITSAACSTRSTGTRSARRRCSRSAVRRCTARSASSRSWRRSARERGRPPPIGPAPGIRGRPSSSSASPR